MRRTNRKDRSKDRQFQRRHPFGPGSVGLWRWMAVAVFPWILLVSASLVRAQDRGTNPAPSGQEKVFLGSPVEAFRLEEKRTGNPLSLLPSVGRGVKLWDEVRSSPQMNSGSGSHDTHASIRRVGR